MKPQKRFWRTVLLLATLGLAGCPIPPDTKQKGVGPVPQEKQEIERSRD